MPHPHPRPKLLRTTNALFSLLFVAMTVAALAADDAAYSDEMEVWHRQRIERLTAEDGWLTVIGLYWLDEGRNTLGSAPDSKLRLPAGKGPDRAGSLFLEGDRIRIEADPDVTITHGGEPIVSMLLATDTSEEPTILDLGDLQFFIIERGGRYGLRVRDRLHSNRSDFIGIDRFPIDPEWRITGYLERHDPPRAISIPNVLGTVGQQPSPGTVTFDAAGQTYQIDALEGPGGGLFLIFADQTSGRESYGGGRFLYTDPVQPDGTVVVDFNRAYNPPCAFTDFATCPLPPRQNKLALRINAGEKSYGHH